MNYTLLDGVQTHAKYPDTFEIPSDLSKDAINPGDFVKVGFILPTGQTERMWVEVESIIDQQISGKLSNDPILFPPNVLKDKDAVLLTKDNVLAILEPAS